MDKVMLGRLLCIGVCFITGCDFLEPVSFVKVEKERTQLIDGIESYQSVEECRGILRQRGLKWEEKSNEPVTGNRPPYNINTFFIKNYSHLGFSGKLSINFFNNRLMSTTFSPADITPYVETLKKEYGWQPVEGKDIQVAQYLTVRFAIDYSVNNSGVPYIAWIDSRLGHEFSLWIERYA